MGIFNLFKHSKSSNEGSTEFIQCHCGNYFYPDEVEGDLEYHDVDTSDYDGTECFDCAYRSLTGDDYESVEVDGVPSGCLACGGDYPFCRSGCSLFDD